jgi:flavin-binding protein dodecin
MFSWLTTKTRQGLAARVKELEADLHTVEVDRLCLQEYIRRVHKDFKPELLDLFTELESVVKGFLPTRDFSAPVIHPAEREVRLRDVLHRLNLSREKAPPMSSELMKLLDITPSSPEEIEAAQAQARDNIRMRDLSPDALSNIHWFEQKELKEARERIAEYRGGQASGSWKSRLTHGTMGNTHGANL